MNNLNHYYKSDKCNIFYWEGAISDKFISQLDDSCFIFEQFLWNVEYPRGLKNQLYTLEVHMETINQRCEKLAPKFDVKTQMIYCSPNEQVHQYIKKSGYASILLNHNCFLDYNKFLLKEGQDREYNAVINSRPFWWKRIYLAENVKNLAYIAGKDWANDENSWTGYKDWNNVSVFHKIPYYEVNEIYNKSMCGLVLSGCTGDNHQKLMEGANYSSSEYLFCGLPVVSTKSQGGREYWFDEKNSIICDPSAQSVKESVELIIEKLNNGEMNRAEIRQTQIQKMNEMRKNFITKTQEIFNDKKIDENSSKYFDDNYFHKMTDYSYEE